VAYIARISFFEGDENEENVTIPHRGSRYRVGADLITVAPAKPLRVQWIASTAAKIKSFKLSIPDRQVYAVNPDAAFLSKVAFSVFSIHSAAQLQKTGGGGDALLAIPSAPSPTSGKVGSWQRD